MVSGTRKSTQTSCSTIMPEKKAKIVPGWNVATIIGKRSVTSAAKIQCVKLPSDWPAARTRFGKTSAMKTQMTVPCPTAWAAMKAKTHAGTIATWSGVKTPRAEAERGDVAERADQQQRAAAEAVDQPEADEREDQIRDANADRGEQRRRLPEAGQFEDARGEVENRVHARHLVEERHEERQHDRRARRHDQKPAVDDSVADDCSISSATRQFRRRPRRLRPHTASPASRSPRRAISQRGLSGSVTQKTV